ncbi:unnamed protein product [Oikopleura dioica]|uniref:Uncharacterized protein n=1 Tax=Oikopleura dioica TaxID=34765 RepID=E4XUL0_OIKDI|nr:unnamed protein product [Oikopleura dioica]
MSSRPSTPPYSESLISKTTKNDSESQNAEKHEISKAAINELIEQKNELIWRALGDAQTTWMKKQSEMQKKIDDLENSEQELKNKVENFELANAELVDRVEKVEIANAELKRMLNDMEISGQIKQLNQQHEGERKEWKNETRKMGEKMEALELNLRNEIEKKHELEELEMMRKELGDIGGAGHFFGNDKRIKYGGERDAMGEEELKKVLRLLAKRSKMAKESKSGLAMHEKRRSGEDKTQNAVISGYKSSTCENHLVVKIGAERKMQKLSVIKCG